MIIMRDSKYHPHHHRAAGGVGVGVADDGGVEEQKEEMVDDVPIINGHEAQHHPHYPNNNGGHHNSHNMNAERSKDDVGDEHSFAAQLEGIAKTVFGSCGSVLDFFSHPDKRPGGGGGGGGGQAGFGHAGMGMGGAGSPQSGIDNPKKPALSIAEELRKIAIKEGRNPDAQPRSADIPKFLGENEIYSFEDDNISAISQHTLEEMAHKGVLHPLCQRPSSLGMAPTNSNGDQSADDQKTPAPEAAPPRQRRRRKTEKEPV